MQKCITRNASKTAIGMLQTWLLLIGNEQIIAMHDGPAGPPTLPKQNWFNSTVALNRDFRGIRQRQSEERLLINIAEISSMNLIWRQGGYTYVLFLLQVTENGE